MPVLAPLWTPAPQLPAPQGEASSLGPDAMPVPPAPQLPAPQAEASSLGPDAMPVLAPQRSARQLSFGSSTSSERVRFRPPSSAPNPFAGQRAWKQFSPDPILRAQQVADYWSKAGCSECVPESWAIKDVRRESGLVQRRWIYIPHPPPYPHPEDVAMLS